MKTTLSPDMTAALVARLDKGNIDFSRAFPGESPARQPVHVVYGGAHRFSEATPQKLAHLAQQALATYAPDFATLAHALELEGHQSLPADAAGVEALTKRLEASVDQVRAEQPAAARLFQVYRRVEEKLQREAVEDFRLDFEDGYGLRPDAEEDGHAVAAAQALARGLGARTLPPFIGIRIKPLARETRARALRTLDVFLSALAEATAGHLPPGFVVTLPKVQHVGQVEALVQALELLEPRLGLPVHGLKLELMVELTQTLVSASGELLLPKLVAASRGRCVAAHFGTYDYTASAGITSNEQRMRHPACDFARHVMQVCLSRTGVFLSDGATTQLPLPPHQAPAGGALSAAQGVENGEAVHAAWRAMAANLGDSLARGFFQGWDLHPAQLPVRYAVVYDYFLRAQADAAQRLRNFVQQAARATTVGTTFDDAATGQGLLNFFLRAVACGAMTADEVAAHTGVTVQALQQRSFAALVEEGTRS